MSQKKTIAIDIDDVLAVFATQFVKYSNDKWGTQLVTSDYTEHWSQMWQIDTAETNKRATEWYASGHTASLPPNLEARKILEILSKKYDLVITTSRHNTLRPETEQWVAINYPGIFKSINFAGIWDDHKTSHDELIKATKAQLCKSIGASYLIDDQPKHCVAAAEAGIQSLLFGFYPWNKEIKLKESMCRVANWGEVKEYFDNEPG